MFSFYLVFIAFNFLQFFTANSQGPLLCHTRKLQPKSIKRAFSKNDTISIRQHFPYFQIGCSHATFRNRDDNSQPYFWIGCRGNDKRVVKSDDVHTCSYHDVVDDNNDEREKEGKERQFPALMPLVLLQMLSKQQDYWVTWCSSVHGSYR